MNKEMIIAVAANSVLIIALLIAKEELKKTTTVNDLAKGFSFAEK